MIWNTVQCVFPAALCPNSFIHHLTRRVHVLLRQVPESHRLDLEIRGLMMLPVARRSKHPDDEALRLRLLSRSLPRSLFACVRLSMYTVHVFISVYHILYISVCVRLTCLSRWGIWVCSSCCCSSSMQLWELSSLENWVSVCARVYACMRV